MRTSLHAFVAVSLCHLCNALAVAALVPPVEPILPFSSHPNEDHSGHDHSFENLRNVDLTDASFASANLTGSIIGDGEFDGLDLTNATLIGADLRGFRTNVEGALFVGADLRNTTWDDAAPAYSDFRNARLGGANLSELTVNFGDFRGALFTDVFYGDALFTDPDFRGSIYNSTTLFPVGIDPIAWGFVFVPEPSTLALAALGALGLLAAVRRKRRCLARARRVYWRDEAAAVHQV